MFPLSKKTITYKQKLFDLLFDEIEIKQAVKTIGSQINQHYSSIQAQQPIIVISVLQKSVMFFSDLQKQFTFRMIPEFIFERDLLFDNEQNINLNSLHFEVVQNKHVLLVANSFEKGSCIPSIVDKINQANPKSLQIAILVSGFPEDCELNNAGTYIAFRHPSQNLTGYGFNGKEKLSGLPQVYMRANKENEEMKKTTQEQFYGLQ